MPSYFNAYFDPYANDAYTYYDQNIAALPKNPDGSWKTSDPAFHNTAVDAFRHAYAAAAAQYKNPDAAIEHIGYLHELLGSDSRYAAYNGVPSAQPPAEMNMDLWNNHEGYEIYNALAPNLTEANYQNMIGDAVKQRLDTGQLITNPDNPNNPTFDTDTIPLIDEAFVDMIGDILDTPAQAEELLGDIDNFFDQLGQGLLDFFDNFFAGSGPLPADLITTAYKAYQSALTIIAPKDPLVLDLDGDGIHTIAQADSDAFFDLDGDVFAEQTAWISGDDGFLVQDHNANGYVDGIGELFGNDTLPGLDELAALDSDSNGKITSADTGWNTLKVWQDADEDGVTDAGELHSLADLNITELRFTGQHDGRTVNGVQFADVASFTIDGDARELAELLFPNSDFEGRKLAQRIAQNAMVFSQGIGSREARLLNTI